MSKRRRPMYKFLVEFSDGRKKDKIVYGWDLKDATLRACDLYCCGFAIRRFRRDDL